MLTHILALGESHLSDALPTLFGFVFVMAVLVILWWVTALIGKIATRESASKTATQTQAIPAAMSANDGIKPETVAVIAAAVHCSLGATTRLVSIQPISSDWSAEGRRQIFASHRVR